MLKIRKKLQVVVFKIGRSVGGEVRQVNLYSRLACAQKRQKCKFVPKLLSLILVAGTAMIFNLGKRNEDFTTEK